MPFPPPFGADEYVTATEPRFHFPIAAETASEERHELVQQSLDQITAAVSAVMPSHARTRLVLLGRGVRRTFVRR
jgi:hypothetical protein